MFIAALMLAGSVQTGPPIPRQRYEPSCPSCSPAVVEEIHLAPDHPSAIVDAPLSFEMSGSGATWVAFPGGALPGIFSRSGEYLGALGRQGQGPGEYLQAHGFVALPGDSMLVLDFRNARATVLAPDREVVRTISGLPSVTELVIVSWPERVIFNAVVRTPNEAGFPMHVGSMAGDRVTIAASTGGTGDVTPGSQHLLLRKLAKTGGGEVLAAGRVDYLLERYSAQGVLESSVVRRPDWFDHRSPWSWGFYDDPPPPLVDAIAVDDEDQIWVFFRIPREGWADAWPPGLDPTREIPGSLLPDQDRLWRTRIEVLSPDGRQLIAASEQDGVVIGALNGPWAIRLTTNAMGTPLVDLLRFDLRRDGSR